MERDRRVENLLRELAPRVVGLLARRCGDVHAAEDAVQEALVAAALQWPGEGLPDNPRGWLVQVASRRLVDQVRSESARRRREQLLALQEPPASAFAPPADDGGAADRDDTLTLLFLCCHPSLSPPSAIALTLRAIGGLTTAEIARAFLVPEATMAQRISRAKQTLRAGGAVFRMPDREDWPRRLDAVLHVLYLVFTEGHTSSAGGNLQRPDLAREAIRLARALRGLLPDDPEVAGLLALMLLTDARAAARTRPDGSLVPLDEQDRSRWDAEAVAEGVALVTEALPRGRVGPYQLQAAIAAVHDEAPTAAETDWPQILALYGVLERVSDNPLVTLSRAVAEAMVHGPAAGLRVLSALDGDRRVAGSHRVHAVRAHLLERSGDRGAAVEEYRRAAGLATSVPERDYLRLRLARLSGGDGAGPPG
jgi:RNA polymerase sigma factor (sigma-70 family)